MPAKDFEKVSMPVGAKIALAREIKKWTQEHLAGLCNIHKTTMANIESGDIDVSMKTLLRIAEELQVETRDLFPE